MNCIRSLFPLYVLLSFLLSIGPAVLIGGGAVAGCGTDTYNKGELKSNEEVLL